MPDRDHVSRTERWWKPPFRWKPTKRWTTTHIGISQNSSPVKKSNQRYVNLQADKQASGPHNTEQAS